eukprot:scaffold150380_cov28-Tisochrysis_lutea.AAC.5
MESAEPPITPWSTCARNHPAGCDAEGAEASALLGGATKSTRRGERVASTHFQPCRPSEGRHIPRLYTLDGVFADALRRGAHTPNEADGVAKHIDGAHCHHQVAHHLRGPLCGGDGSECSKRGEDVVHLQPRASRAGV